MDTFQFLLICVAGWLNRNHQGVIAYLQEVPCRPYERTAKPSPEIANALGVTQRTVFAISVPGSDERGVIPMRVLVPLRRWTRRGAPRRRR